MPQPTLDQVSGVTSLLHGHLRHARQRLISLVLKMGQVANDEQFRVTGYRQVGLYDDAAFLMARPKSSATY